MNQPLTLTPEQEAALHALLWQTNLPATGGGPQVQTLVSILGVMEARSDVRLAVAEASISTRH